MELIKKSVSKGINYKDYRNTIKNNLSYRTKEELESDTLLNYTFLNNKRMDRLDKTIHLSEQTLTYLQKFNKKITLLVIAESWCGDAAQILPVINKMASQNNQINVKIVFRDENEALMNRFLTNGSKSIPKVIVIDEQNQVLNSWGPRPSTATNMVLNYKNKHGKLDAAFKKDLQIWYNKDKGLNTQEDIIKLLKAS
ncbi:MAG: thioredoxin family protein [Lutibacter sp.]